MKEGKGAVSKFWYAIIQIMVWGGFGLILCYCSNFMKSMDFADSHVSIVLGTGTAVSVLAQLLLAELIQRVKILTTAGTLVLQGAVLVAGGILMFQNSHQILAIVGICMGCVVVQTIPSLANALATESDRMGQSVNYPIARGLGSLAYSLISFLAGQLIGKAGIVVIPLMTLLMGGVLCLAALCFAHTSGPSRLEKVDRKSRTPEQDGAGRGFFKKYPGLVFFLMGSILLYTNHSFVSTFMQQIMSAKGAGAGQQGIAIAISGLMELPAMFGFACLLKKAPCAKWLRISCICFAIKAVLTLAAPNALWVYVAQIFQMGGFATYQVGSVEYMGTVVEAEDAVRGQTYLATTLTVGSLIAFCVGGFICQYAGVSVMLTAAVALALLGSLLVFRSTTINRSCMRQNS